MTCILICILSMLFMKIAITTRDYLYLGVSLGFFAMYIGIYLAGGGA